MKGKKWVIILIIILLLVILCAGLYCWLGNRESILVSHDGSTVSNGKNDLIEHIKKTEDVETRESMINFCIEQNLLTQEEANVLH